MKIDSAYYTKDKDTIILQFPTDKYDVNGLKQIYDTVADLFPDNNVLCIPEDISISILRQENPFL